MKFVFSLFLLFSSLGASATSSELRVLFIDELTMRDEKTPSWGQDSLDGLKLALQKTSGITVKAVGVHRSPVLAYEAVKTHLKEIDMVVGLRTSAQALMVKKITDEHQLPFISIMATSDRLIDPKGSSFMMAARNSYQIESIVKTLWPQKSSTYKVGIVTMQNCVYCEEMAEVTMAKLAEKGIPSVLLGQTMFQEPVPAELFKDSNQFSHIGLYLDEIGGMAAIKLLKQKNFNGTVFGGDSWSINNIAPENRDEYKGICLVNAVTHAKSRMQKEFVNQYKSTFGRSATDLAMLGYDTGLLLAKINEDCANKRGAQLNKCMRKNMPQYNFNGASGNVQFTKDGGRTRASLEIEKYDCKKVKSS